MKLEGQLGVLDAAGWSDLKRRAAAQLHKRQSGRGWQPLFDVFSEARAFGYLAAIGCTDIRFIPRTSTKTPDLRARQGSTPVFCEVKTLNISMNEAERRDRVYRGEIFVTSTELHVANGFLNKLTVTLEHAVDQLDAADARRAARRIIFTVVHFDDRVGDCQPQYFADIDAHLLAHPVSGAELVFCAASNLFETDVFDDVSDLALRLNTQSKQPLFVRPTYDSGARKGSPKLAAISLVAAARGGGASGARRNAASALRQFEKRPAGAAIGGGAVSTMAFGSSGRRDDCWLS